MSNYVKPDKAIAIRQLQQTIKLCRDVFVDDYPNFAEMLASWWGISTDIRHAVLFKGGDKDADKT